MVKKISWFTFLLFLIFIAVILINTFRKTAPEGLIKAIPAPAVSDAAIAHLTRAITYQTISYGDTARFDSTQFVGFRKFLQDTYPLMFSRLQWQVMAGYTLLMQWPGRDTGLKPVILMAHQDVVPIEASTRDQWTVDPFAGTVKDGYIWGRGTTDDKINLIAQCEAIEKLLQAGFVPARTVYLIFGHDEEVGGKGAKAVAAYMEKAGIQAELLLDEGGIITREKMPGMQKPVALLGTAEKGYLSVTLTATATGGHSSMPEAATAVDILSKALISLRDNPFPAKYTEPMRGLMDAVGPEMPFLQRMAFANPWLFKGIITRTYQKTGAGNAMLHTTLVPTIIEGGIKDNVVPSEVKAVVNLRLLPGDSSEKVMEQLRAIINDPRVEVSHYSPQNVAEPSPVTSARGFGYQKIAQIMKQTYPDVVPSPFLMIGATDSRHFGKVSSNIIKFSPMIDPIGFHGIDERVSLESYQTALWFYEMLLRNTN